MIAQLARMLRPLQQRIMLMIGRGVLLAASQEKGRATLAAQMMADDLPAELRLLQHFGFASLPMEGGEVLVVFPGGDRAQGYAVATDDRRYRPALEPGEVVLYCEGDHLTEGEELPEVPEGAPQGWPGPSEDPEAPAPGLCRISMLPDRTIRIIGGRLQFMATEQLDLCSPSILIGPPGAQVELGGEEGRKLARIGDCADVAAGSSLGKWPIVEGCA